MSMNRDEFYNSLYLAHHGVKGQKWGIRRYQNEDGSYTEEGAKRRRSDNKSGISDGAKKALKAGAIAAGTALAAIGAYKLYQMNKPITAFTAFDMKKDVARIAARELPGKLKEKYSSKIKDLSDKAKKGAKNTLRDAGKAAASAAITAIGTIAVHKATSYFKEKEGDSEEVRNTKLIGKEATSAAIRSTINSASGKVSTNGFSNGGGFSSQTLNNLVSEVGKPHQTHSWGEVETMKRYNNIMDAYRTDDNTKQQIRMMKKSGFDIDQIEKKYSK